MPSTDPVSPITNCYRLIVSYTDPVHSFIISKRTVEPTGSSFHLILLYLDSHLVMKHLSTVQDLNIRDLRHLLDYHHNHQRRL